MKKPSLNELIRERLAQGLPVTVQWAKDQGYTANAFRVAMHRIRKAKQ